MIEYIPTPKINTKFNDQLEIESNLRVILSGKFGSGKTTFLRNFFDDNKNYDCIRIAPVNYSVSENKDIFELIKYDIIFQLIGKVELSELDNSIIDKFKIYVGSNKADALKIFTPFLKMIPQIGNSLSASSDRLIDFVSKLTESLNDKISDKNEVEAFFNKHSIIRGSIYEEDIYTTLIRELICKLKEKKKVVLVVDDLDRIDPEHIFRILNVFSAHNDVHKDGTNKFDFNKVIVVCDIDNIRNIFQHKYGGKTDFNGYIDKFYSKQIFRFDSSEYLKEIVDKIFSSIEGDDQFYANIIQNKSVRDFTTMLLVNFIEDNNISFRNITRLVHHKYASPNYSITVGGRKRLNMYLLLIPVFNFLEIVVGDTDKLDHILNEHINSQFKEVGYISKDWVLSVLYLPIIFQDKLPISSGDNELINGKVSESFEVNFSFSHGSPLIVNTDSFTSIINSINFNKILYQAFTIARDKNQLK